MTYTLGYTLLPPHIRPAVKRYVEHGVPPGGFLMYVISNNLRMAYITADLVNREKLGDILKFFFDEVPANCWGSREAMDYWIAQGGMGGQYVQG